MSRFTGASLVDIDNDGLKDLFVTEACGEPIGSQNGPGGIKYYKNTGSLGSPVFTFQEYVDDVKGNKIEHLYLRAQFADMDNDGLADIVTGENDFNGVPSELRFYKNIGTITEPSFDTAIVLTHIDGNGILADNAIHFGIADIDNDGVKDILLNARHHNIKNYSNWQYEAKLGFLRGYLPTTKINTIPFVKSNSCSIVENKIIYNGIKSVKVYDFKGRVIYNSTFENEKQQLNINELNLNSGVYLIFINNIKIKYSLLD